MKYEVSYNKSRVRISVKRHGEIRLIIKRKQLS